MVIPSNRDISIKIQKRVPIQLRPPIFPFSGDSFFNVIYDSKTPIAVINELKINTLRHPDIDAIRSAVTDKTKLILLNSLDPELH